PVVYRRKTNWSSGDDGCMEPPSTTTGAATCAGSATICAAPSTSCGSARQYVSIFPCASAVSGGALTASGEHCESASPAVVSHSSVTDSPGRKPVPVTWVSVPSVTTAGFATIFGFAQPPTVMAVLAGSGWNTLTVDADPARSHCGISGGCPV